VPVIAGTVPHRAGDRGGIAGWDLAGCGTAEAGAEDGAPGSPLRMLGCPIAQGFYFSQPLRAGEFDDLLTRHFACTSASG
jgi:predicted signal transduction protein with EAL and GGDEF domain